MKTRHNWISIVMEKINTYIHLLTLSIEYSFSTWLHGEESVQKSEFLEFLPWLFTELESSLLKRMRLARQVELKSPRLEIWGVSIVMGGTPIAGWFLLGTIPLKRMMTGGTPISGNHHLHNIFLQYTLPYLNWMNWWVRPDGMLKNSGEMSGPNGVLNRRNLATFSSSPL